MLSLGLEYESSATGGTVQYNGNIATLQWNTYINSTSGTRQLYRFGYDAANRLLTADHRTWSGSAWTDPNRYNESGITYDLNGNIKGYTRRGLTTAPSTFGTIDQLTYYYDDAARPDRLTRVVDAGVAAKGFVYNALATTPHYVYDANGNLVQDKHKDLFINYNPYNLPNSINNSADSYITLMYTADGEKLTKVAGGTTRNYVAGIEYLGANLDAIYHTEGRCTPNGATLFHYEYTLKDHLGNARVNFRANGAAVTFLEELHYYPFGMLMEGISTTPVTVNAYKYNGKEINMDLGLNWSDYGARWYDASVGRWWSVDPMSEKYQFWSIYNYTLGNPIKFIDPDGKKVEDWYRDSDGTVQYAPSIKSQNDLAGDQIYLGESFTEKGESGRLIYYNNGGSIFFKNETDAYNYIWNNTEKTNREHLGVVFSDGVSVLPSYANDANTSKIEEVGFRFLQTDGKSFLVSDNYTHKNPVLGTVHSHNADKSGSEGVSMHDIIAFGSRTPGRPALVFENNENGVGGFLDGVVSYSRKDWAPIDRKSMPSLSSVLSGKASLIELFKQIK